MPAIEKKNASNKPAVGILMLDTKFPRIPGDVGNPDTFSFPINYKLVKGADPVWVVNDPDSLLLHHFIKAAKELEMEGVKAISTSCGFLSIYHRELVEALQVPIYTSSLIQVHTARTLIKNWQKVGIITASKKSLTRKHLLGVGIQSCPIAVTGMEHTKEFAAVFLGNKETIDIEQCRREMISAAETLVNANPNVGAIVLECTNMPPYAKDIQRAVGMPVFDVVTMINYAYEVVTKQKFL